ncbi:MAG: leucine-rich repeat domain-containing protein [Lachnospiraceae bacterium]|nr:leucine-rich repeat domain-containing protein [Lachnospiraceae bacterium]
MRQRLKWILGIPAAAALAVLLIGGYVSSKAASAGVDFNINGKELVGYTGTDSVVTVPNGIEVIGRGAFAANPNITEVKLPDTVIEISYGAFADCTALQKITLPNAVTTIGDSAFNHCVNLQSVTIGSGLRTLGSGAFADCDSLSSVRIAANNKYFSCVDGVIYDASQSKIYQYLSGRQGRQYRMPDTVTDIVRYAFWGCDRLEDITFSSGLTKIPDYAIADAGSVETVKINAPLCTIGLKAFDGCRSLKQIIFPVSVTEIHDTAFDSCNKEALFVCEAGSYVDNYALEHGFATNSSAVYQISYFDEGKAEQSTQNVALEAKPEDIKENPSASNTNTGNTYVGTSYQTTDGVVLGNARIVSDRVFVMAGNMVVTDGSTLSGSQESVTLSAVADYAYYNRTDLTSYDFATEGSIEVIGQLAFARTGLTQAVLPEGLRTVSYGAFYHCDQLTDVVIPSTVTNVEAYAFEHTPWLENWRNSSDKEDYLIVGDGVLISYKGSDAAIVIPEEVKYIASGVFRDHHELTSVTFPAGLISIGSYAFAGCSGLTEKIGLTDTVYQDTTAFE